jgi:uncharacterized protein (TIGR02246 family)
MSAVHIERAAEPRAVAATLFTSMAAAWGRADGAAFGTLFSTDADFVDIRGSHHRGADAIAQGHQAIFDTIYAGSTVSYQVDRAGVVAPGCVVAVISSTLDAPTGPLQGINHARITAVITDGPGGWEITALQNTLVRS